MVGSDGSPVARLPLNTVGEHPGDADGVGDALGDGDGVGVGAPPGIVSCCVFAITVGEAAAPPTIVNSVPLIPPFVWRTGSFRLIASGATVVHVLATGS